MPAYTALFEGHPIRRIYDAATDTWWFSVVDIVQVLTQQPDSNTARKYWNKLKQRLREEGSQLVTNCHQLKMTAADGKERLTDCATPEELGTRTPDGDTQLKNAIRRLKRTSRRTKRVKLRTPNSRVRGLKRAACRP